uniref:polynucleotide adenylyltransferase n=1 Tax=Globodera rostochiensis TaxID=31243 RepID=A0A914I0A5_GLORO
MTMPPILLIIKSYYLHYVDKRFSVEPTNGAQHILLEEFYLEYFKEKNENIRKNLISKIALYTHIYMIHWKLEQNKEILGDKEQASYFQKNKRFLFYIKTEFICKDLYDEAMCFLLIVKNDLFTTLKYENPPYNKKYAKQIVIKNSEEINEWMLSDLLHFFQKRQQLIKYFADILSRNNQQEMHETWTNFVELFGFARTALICNAYINKLGGICQFITSKYFYLFAYDNYFENSTELGKWRIKIVLEFNLYDEWARNFFDNEYEKIYKTDGSEVQPYFLFEKTKFLKSLLDYWKSHNEIFWHSEKIIRERMSRIIQTTKGSKGLLQLKEMVKIVDDEVIDKSALSAMLLWENGPLDTSLYRSFTICIKDAVSEHDKRIRKKGILNNLKNIDDLEGIIFAKLVTCIAKKLKNPSQKGEIVSKLHFDKMSQLIEEGEEEFNKLVTKNKNQLMDFMDSVRAKQIEKLLGEQDEYLSVSERFTDSDTDEETFKEANEYTKSEQNSDKWIDQENKNNCMKTLTEIGINKLSDLLEDLMVNSMKCNLFKSNYILCIMSLNNLHLIHQYIFLLQNSKKITLNDHTLNETDWIQFNLIRTAPKNRKNELELSNEFFNFISSSKIDRNKKAEIISLKKSIASIVENWAEQFTQIKPKLLISGSQLMGAYIDGSDLDLLCVLPDKFPFYHFYDKNEDSLNSFLGKKLHGIISINWIPGKVKILRIELQNIEVDLLSVFIPEKFLLLKHLKLEDDELIRLVTNESSIYALAGYRAGKYQLSLVPSRKEFTALLRAVKIWAKNRLIYASIFGYFNGATLSVMTAKICTLFPHAPLSYLLYQFFSIYSKWNWAHGAPVMLDTITPITLNKFVRKWPPMFNASPMNVITPRFPEKNSAFNVNKFSLRIIIEELNIANQLLSEDFKNWKSIFEKIKFKETFEHFAIILCSAIKFEEFTTNCAFQRSKIRENLSDWANQTKVSEKLKHFQLIPQSEEKIVCNMRNQIAFCRLWLVGLTMKAEYKRINLNLNLAPIYRNDYNQPQKLDVFRIHSFYTEVENLETIVDNLRYTGTQ